MIQHWVRQRLDHSLERIGDRAFRQAWYQAFMWLLYSAVGILFPIGVGLIFVGAIEDSSIGIADITDGGQFAIYTAALLTQTVYLITRPTPRLPWAEWFGFVAIVGVFLSATFFTLALLLSAGTAVDESYFRWPSISLSGGALLLAFLAVGLDNLRHETDLREEVEGTREDLRRQFYETP